MPQNTISQTKFLWLEVTGLCQLECVQCYAGSGPGGTHGSLTAGDWKALISEAAHSGVEMVQFIGGEVTLYPGLAELARHALADGLRVEIFSNLVHISAEQWEMLSLPGISLATSWYTDDPSQHAAITGRDTWRQTKANIIKALERQIPLRAGIIDGIIPAQRAQEARALLESLGVSSIRTDRVREFGRGSIPAPGQTCGGCGRGRAAILPDGTVVPCPMSRWRVAGNVRTGKLAALL